MINADELGVDEDLALRVLATARSIAPGIHDVTEPGKRDELVAVLRGIARGAAERGSLLIRGQRVGPASVDYTAATSWFSDDDRATLRAITRSAMDSSAAPVGSFPQPGYINRLWPEKY